MYIIAVLFTVRFLGFMLISIYAREVSLENCDGSFTPENNNTISLTVNNLLYVELIKIIDKILFEISVTLKMSLIF